MGTRVRNSIYISLTFVYLVHLLLKKNGVIFHGPVNNYLNDLLALPLILEFTRRLLAYRTKRKDFELELSKVIVAIVYVSLLFEWTLPALSSRYTSDWVDIVCYVLGGGAYYILHRLASKKLSIFVPLN